VIRTPIQAPNAKAYAECWVRTVRTDCLDRILILGRRHLEHVLHVYRRHYNEHRPHRALDLLPPDGSVPIERANSNRSRAPTRPARLAHPRVPSRRLRLRRRKVARFRGASAVPPGPQPLRHQHAQPSPPPHPPQPRRIRLPDRARCPAARCARLIQQRRPAHPPTQAAARVCEPLRIPRFRKPMQAGLERGSEPAVDRVTVRDERVEFRHWAGGPACWRRSTCRLAPACVPSSSS
jgi:Integrase core domain